MEAGHSNPWTYTVGRLTDEATIADERINGRIATHGLLVQMAISTQPPELTRPAIRKSNNAAQKFQEFINKMTNGI